MSQQVFDIDTVGYKSNALGGYFDFYVNNVFYLLAPEYYYSFYAIYLNRCISCYDGWIQGVHNLASGYVPQRMLQSIATGLNNMLFAHGIDFSSDQQGDYNFATDWAKKTKFYKAIKKAHKYAIAGGTSLLKLNRKDRELYATAHRIDTFFADIDSTGKIIGVKVFIDAITDTVPSGEGTKDKHYGICEERYFNKDGKACVKASVYVASSNLQTNVQDRPISVSAQSVKLDNLPAKVRKYIAKNYPSIVIGEEQYLPFANSLGCHLMRFTDDIPQVPNLPFGQPIADILFTENFQYDQMKYFEKNEVDLARARALVPEEFWNKDDPNYADRALDERFYQKVSSLNGDSDKITQIQFNLRGMDIKTQMENIYKDCAFKLNVSASSVASFLSEGAGARTATEIISERTKSDTWIKGQINLNAPEINDLLKEVMLYYNHEPVEIILKAEDQSPYIERLKINSDVFGAGNMSPERFVKSTYGNTLSKGEQDREIKFLEETKAQRDAEKQAMTQSWVK